MELSSVISICQAAERAESDAGGRRESSELSSEQQDLLRLAARTGRFRIITTDAVPGAIVCVHTGHCSRKFVDHANPAVAARFFDAFVELCEFGWIRHEEGSRFALSERGLDASRNVPPSAATCE